MSITLYKKVVNFDIVLPISETGVVEIQLFVFIDKWLNLILFSYAVFYVIFVAK